MYLEKLEIQGFKSFANKNTLVFPGMLSKSKRGITAIVGPNGSGKSNVADAVRWALGEQSMKTLRGKKSEDIIFSGSDRKGSLGMAEVSLYLNNEAKKAPASTQRGEPIDYLQVVVTRRLFRNGDSEYLVNNSKVRLYDIQMMLAKAKFGQKTYSVIGQGVVEGFLNTSLAERKEFFDEATGVKQFQIKRDDSLAKLRLSYENLNQAQMLLSEIEPRLKSLTRQVNKLQKRGTIENQLRELQLDYYGKIWHQINDKFNHHNQQFLELEKKKLEKEKKLDQLNNELNKLEQEDSELAQFDQWQKQLSDLQQQKDHLTKQIARLEAQLELKLEANGQFDLSFLTNKKEEIIKEIAARAEEITALEKNIAPQHEKLKQLDKEKNKINQQIEQLNKKLLDKSSLLDSHDSKNVSEKIKLTLAKIEQAESQSALTKIKTVLAEIKQELKQVLNFIKQADEKNDLEKIQQDLTKTTQAKEEVVTKINDTNLRISAWSERIKLLTEEKTKLVNELATIKDKLKQHQDKFTTTEISQNHSQFKKQLAQINEQIKQVQEKMNDYTQEEEEKRTSLFSLQKNLQSLQNEIIELNNQLNEIKINSTRYETKLEDLEIEIRQQSGNLKKIKEHRVKQEIDQEQTLEKINQLKRQLDLIGGIDPEIEKEYVETKERYDFLSSQVNDLSKAIDSFEEIIKELDLTIKERFDKEFKIIHDKFEEYFKILFNGGKAKIIKVMEQEKEETETEEDVADTSGSSRRRSAPPQDDKIINIKTIKFLQKHNATGLAGIEIQACPPGKKIKSINMLSGGERALTAIALICAIISANPSPFVFLDEVDAALDEANSERFAKILDDLSHKTQFIVITHNRATMRKANILYGVTMGDDGVSKLLSIKLEEAKEKVTLRR